MKLKKVISGGQTGADQTGLECAKALGFATGGTAPYNYRTERGSERNLLKSYGLKESNSYDYAERTRANVRDAEVTLWFGTKGSPGYWCTYKAAQQYMRPFVENPTQERMLELAEEFAVWNVAGNRASKNNEVIALVREAFKAFVKE